MSHHCPQSFSPDTVERLPEVHIADEQLSAASWAVVTRRRRPVQSRIPKA